MSSDTFVEGALTLELHDEATAIRVVWSGRSTAREPGKFILPILFKAIEKGVRQNKEVVIDFERLNYLNSSTITPVIRILDQAKRGDAKVVIVYNKSLKWQALSFAALQVFQTTDGRIEIRGV